MSDRPESELRASGWGAAVLVTSWTMAFFLAGLVLGLLLR
jgi:hypothetical protein